MSQGVEAGVPGAGAPAVQAVATEAVFRTVDWWLFGACASALLAAGLWLAVAVPWWPALPAAGPAVLGLLGFASRWFSLPLMRRPVGTPPAPPLRVAAVTTFVPGAESPAMLRRTVAAMVAMRGRHDTWVLDEGDEPAVREMCAELGARHFSRRGHPGYNTTGGRFAARTKHGNYNAWLDAIGDDAYDAIAAFDPDHIPAPSFLERTLGYLADPDVGYVQAAQVYYNQTAGLVARGAAEETYAYYSSLQMTSFALGYPIVTGCHNVNRTAALRSVGGFPAHDADDLLLTVRYRSGGWRGVYVPEVLAVGLTPTTWRAYLDQQRRWARSVIDVKLRHLPGHAGRLPLAERVVATLHGLAYLHGLATAVSVALLAAALATGWGPRSLDGSIAAPVLATAGAGALAEAFRQRFYLDRRSEWGPHLRGGLVKFAKWPWVLLALLDALLGRRFSFALTPKTAARAATRVLARGHVVPLMVVIGAGVVGEATGRTAGWPVLAAAAAYTAVTVGLLASDRFAAAPAYDDALAAAAVASMDGR